LKETSETLKVKSGKVSSSNRPGDKVVELNNKKNSGESKKQSMTGTTPGRTTPDYYTVPRSLEK
jgi:hypothetical protein